MLYATKDDVVDQFAQTIQLTNVVAHSHSHFGKQQIDCFRVAFVGDEASAPTVEYKYHTVSEMKETTKKNIAPPLNPL